MKKLKFLPIIMLVLCVLLTACDGNITKDDESTNEVTASETVTGGTNEESTTKESASNAGPEEATSEIKTGNNEDNVTTEGTQKGNEENTTEKVTNNQQSATTEITTSDTTENIDPDEMLEIVKENTLPAIMQAMSSSVTPWMTDEFELADIISKTLEKGSVSFNLVSDTILADMGLHAVGATFYTDALANNAIVVGVTPSEGEEAYANLWINNEAITVSGALIFGDDTTAYGLKLADLSDEEWILSLMDIFSQYTPSMPTPEDIDKMLAEMEQPKPEVEELMNVVMQLVTELSGKVQPKVTEEDGDIVIKYETTLNDAFKAIKAAVEKITLSDEAAALVCEMMGYEEPMTGEELMSSLMQMLDQTAADAANAADSAFRLELRIDAASFKLTDIKAEIDSKSKTDNSVVMMTLETEISDEKVSVKLYGTDGTETVDATFEVAKLAEAEVIGRTVSFAVIEDEATTALSASFTYDKASGDIEIAINADVPENDPVEIKINGSVVKTADSAKISIDEIVSGEVTMKIELSVEFIAGTEIPEMPEAVTDIKSFTAEEWEAIFESLGLSKVLSGDYENETAVWSFYGSSVSVWVGEQYYFAEYSIDGNMIYFSGYDEGVVESALFSTPLTYELGDGFIIINGETYTEVVYDFIPQ